jgi:predicted transcriptional regulator
VCGSWGEGGGNQRRRVVEVRSKIAYGLNREMGISMAEIARLLGVGASAIAMAIQKEKLARIF